MAYYTKIPESNIPGVLAGRIGKISSTITSKATKTLNECYSQLNTIAKDAYNDIQLRGNTIPMSKVGEFTRELQDVERRLGKKAADKIRIEGFRALGSYQPVIPPYRNLGQVNSKLIAVKSSINQINGIISSIRSTARAIKVPMKGLQVAAELIVNLPLGLWWLWDFTTALESDLLVMLRELIAQITEICEALERLCTTSASTLQVVQEQATQNERFYRTLKLDSDFYDAIAYTTSKDIEILVRLGILDKNGVSIFTKLGPVLGSNQPCTVQFGNPKVDVNSNIVQNYLKVSKPGTTVEIPNQEIGSWVSIIYYFSKEKPETPVSRKKIPDGWTNQCPVNTENWWYSKSVVDKTGYVGKWSKPEPVRESCSQSKLPLPKETYQKIKILGVDSEDYTEGLALFSAEQGEELLINMLQKLNTSSVSKELKNILVYSFESNIKEESIIETKPVEMYITSSNGDVYKLSIKEDTETYSIAPRYYAVAETLDGVVVLEGNKTFSTDTELLLQELKVGLEQLLN